MKNIPWLLITIATAGWIFSWMLLDKIGEQTGIGINTTSSQLPGIYAYSPIKNPLQKGELVDCYLDLSEPILKWITLRNYLGKNKKCLKNIGALPGDWLFTVYPNVYRCDQKYLTKKCVLLGICMKKDSHGYPVFCQMWHGVKIPIDYFYLQSNRVLNSFDSRYFGLVSIKNIRHKVKIIWKFS